MVVIAAILGFLGGLAAVAFRKLIEFVNLIAWGEGPVTIAHLSALPAWWKILVPAAGGLIVGLIIYRFAREAKGHGVPEVMEAVALHGGRIRPRVVIAKMFASGICIGSGGSVGREGPIVQIGSALGSTIGQWLKIDPSRLRTLVACGAAAGIAGTFNAPVAGALFALEIILGDFGVIYFSPIVVSSVAATVVSRHFLGDFPAFNVPAHSLVHASELLAYSGLGVLAALAALAFTNILYVFEDAFDRLRVTPPLRTAIGGAIIGLMGLFVPQIFGVGYEVIEGALRGGLVWHFMLALVLLKILAVSVTIGSGGSGGIFAPSLFIGAMLGGSVGTVIHSFWPTATAGAGAYALVGMGAVVAAATRAPITAILIIFELTGDYKIMLPLMISSIIATMLATRLQQPSIYTLKLLRRGIDLRRGQAVNVLEDIPVGEIVRSEVAEVSPEESLASLISKILEQPQRTLFVIDDDRRLLGIVAIDEIRPVLKDPAALEGLVIAEDVMADDRCPNASPDDSLADMMKYLGTYQGQIPVLEGQRIVGVIWPEDVIKRYNAELFKRDMAGGLASAVGGASARIESLPAAGGQMVAEIPVPSHFVGKTIRELAVRQNYGVSILMIKRATAGQDDLTAAPTADYEFQPGDTILVIGPPDRVVMRDEG